MNKSILKFIAIFFIVVFSIPLFSCVEAKTIVAPDYHFEIGNDGIKITEYDEGGQTQDISAGTAWTKILNEYNGIIKIIYGLFLLTCVLVFIINFTKLGSTGGNPQARQNCMMGLIVSGIGTALLGGIGMFFQYAYNFFI